MTDLFIDAAMAGAVLLVTVVAFWAGYHCGRWDGWHAGLHRGLTFGRLKLHEQEQSDDSYYH